MTNAEISFLAEVLPRPFVKALTVLSDQAAVNWSRAGVTSKQSLIVVQLATIELWMIRAGAIRLLGRAASV